MRLAVLVLSLSLLSTSALAQDPEDAGPATEGPTPEQLAEARALFADGVRYAGGGEFERAVIAFRRAKEIKDAPAIRYNLASALFETGGLVEAAKEAQTVADDPEAPAELSERASVLVREIRRQLATLTIRLGGEADGVRVDDRLLTAEELRGPISLEPGTHTVVGLRQGRETTRRELEIPAGGQAHIDVSVIPSPVETAAATPPTADPEPGTTLVKDWRFWTVVGAGVVAVVTVIIIIAAVSGGTEDPAMGDFQPGVLEW